MHCPSLPYPRHHRPPREKYNTQDIMFPSFSIVGIAIYNIYNIFTRIACCGLKIYTCASFFFVVNTYFAGNPWDLQTCICSLDGCDQNIYKYTHIGIGWIILKYICVYVLYTKLVYIATHINETNINRA